MPLAAGLALLRRSSSPAGSFAAATLIEAVRGVPLVTQLLFASFVLPMLLGGGVSVQHGAGRADAAHRLPAGRGAARRAASHPAGPDGGGPRAGHGSALAYQAVIWPQARRIAAPAALGVFVGAVKDTSLVSIIGVFDVLGAAKAVVAGTAWRPYHVEVYLAVAALYFAASLALSRVARAMETGGSERPASEAFVEDRRQHQFPHESSIGQAEQRPHHRHHIVHRRQRALAAPAGVIARHRQPVLGVQVAQLQAGDRQPLRAETLAQRRQCPTAPP